MGSMSRLRPSPTTVLALVAVFAALGGSAFAITAGPSQTGAITACYKTKTGALRIVAATKKCAKGERRLTWNAGGQAGVPGPQGAPGATPG